MNKKREILYRAWDPEYKVMAQVMELNFLGRGGVIPYVYLHHKDIGFWTRDMADVDLMEYTGKDIFIPMSDTGILRGMNVAKVFEGDIIECIYDPEIIKDEPLTWRGVVLWKPEIGFSVYRFHNKGVYSISFSGPAVKSYKVVGNMWENPGMME